MQVFIGGLPKDIQAESPELAALPSIAGCIDQFQVNSMPMNLSEMNSYRVDFSGCPATVAPGVRFSGKGLAEFQLREAKLNTLTFNFRTSQLKALLLQTGNLTISIFHTKIRVDIFNITLLSAESGLNDDTLRSAMLEFEDNSSLPM